MRFQAKGQAYPTTSSKRNALIDSMVNGVECYTKDSPPGAPLCTFTRMQSKTPAEAAANLSRLVQSPKPMTTWFATRVHKRKLREHMEFVKGWPSR